MRRLLSYIAASALWIRVCGRLPCSGARDADAGGDREPLLLEPEAVAEGIEDGIGDALGPILVVLGAAYDQEFVAAEAGDQALGAHRAHDPARGVHQQFVAGVVAEHVVDHLDRKSTRLNSSH